MRIKIIVLALFLPSISLFGQDFLPFLEEGKVWNYDYYGVYDVVPQQIQVYVGGDTVVAGVACKKMVESRSSQERCIGAFYEQEGKVWAFYPDTYGKEQPAKLLYDFSCQEGDLLTNLVAGLDGGHVVKVEKVELVECYGIQRRLVTLSITPPLISGRKDNMGYWLEGIGSRFDVYTTWPAIGGISFFNNCTLNGEPIASRSSFASGRIDMPVDKMWSIVPVNNGSQKGNIYYYDLQGRRLAAPPAKDIYVKDGRKVVVE